MAASSPSVQRTGDEKRLGSEKGAGSRSASGNRVKSKPAKDAVIKGILSQLGSLDATQTSSAARHTSFTRPDFSDFDSGTRPGSPTGSFASAPSVPFSPSNLARSPRPVTAASDDDDDEAFDDVATPPIVPITRSPMRLSQLPTSHNAPSSEVALNDVESVAGTNFKRGSLQPLRTESPSVSHKPSKESWATAEQHSPSQTRKQIRRVESHETLRQAQPDKDFQPDQDFILNGLGSLATIPRPVTTDGAADDDYDDGAAAAHSPSRRRSPKMLGKARMYFQDSIEDLQRATAADLAVKSMENADTISNHSRGSSAGPSTPRPSKTRSAASKPSPISDSIPLRTSSLRQSQSPASTGRRSKMKSSVSHSGGGSVVRTISENAEDEQWAELGEDDETVRRIKELRKKRKSRLLDEAPAAPPVRSSSALTHRGPDVNTPTRSHSSASKNANKPSTIDDKVTIRLLGPELTLDEQQEQEQEQQQQQQQDNRSATHDAASSLHPAGSGANPIEGTGRLQLIRPQTPEMHASPVRPLSLDYSYAQAVDELQSASNNSSPQRRSRKAQQGMSAVQPIAFYHRRTTSNTSTTSNSLLRPKKQRTGRLIGANSDDGDEKNRSRRKSMSDARKSGDDGLEPQRRDSVEHAVLEYLHDPRLSQHVLDPQTNRRISFSEVGDSRGAAVMVCVGMGLTRFVTAFFDELATTLRLRLITIERPGVGQSEPYPPNDRSGPLMWATDVTTVTEHLGISKFSILAHSAGAVYALAVALTLPHYVRGSIHLLGPWIPPSQLEAVSYATDNAIPAGALPRSQRILRVLPAPLIRMANNSFVFSSLKPEKASSGTSQNGPTHTSSETSKPLPKRPTTSSGPRPENPRRESMMLMDQFMPETNPMENFPLSNRNDEKVGEVQRRRSSVFLGATINPNDPSFTFAGEALNAAEHSAREREVEFSSRLTQRTWEYAIKDSNPATDLLVCLERNREIGFRYTDITRRVIITHGSDDKRVPVGNVKWLADQMNRAVMQRHAISRDTLLLDSIAEPPGCELRILDNEGHGLMASPIIMADILTEIAGYWTAEERGRRPSHNL